MSQSISQSSMQYLSTRFLHFQMGKCLPVCGCQGITTQLLRYSQSVSSTLVSGLLSLPAKQFSVFFFYVLTFHKTWFKNKKIPMCQMKNFFFHDSQSAFVWPPVVVWNGAELLKGKKRSFSEESETAMAVSKVQLQSLKAP